MELVQKIINEQKRVFFHQYLITLCFAFQKSTFNISLINNYSKKMMNNQLYEHLIKEYNYISTLNTLQHSYFLPYVPPIHYFQNQQKNELISNPQIIKQFKDCAIQTDEAHFLRHDRYGSLSSDSESIKEQIKQLPFPNREKLFNVFQCRSVKRSQIQEKIDQICNPKTKLLNSFYKLIGEKILGFKKTKQEIIKFLIRRAWKKQESGVVEAREKYYSQFKSMNSSYLTKIFKDGSFTAAFEEMLKDFQNDFDAYNSHRFNRFYDFMLNCYVNNNLSQFKCSKECKSKLPYPQYWKQHVRQIAFNLYESYCGQTKQKDFLQERNQEKNNQEQ